jgi:GT2 family glycosyltransferase
LDFSIVVPCFNHIGFTRKCVQSILDCTDFEKYKYELIVVANGCDDSTEEYILEVQRTCKVPIILYSSKNALGAGEAINTGIRISKGNYIVTLNNDCVILGNHWLEFLKGPFIDESMGITGSLDLYSPEVESNFILFFCVMVKREVFDKIGLLDTKTFDIGYGEDIDFCQRAKKVGYKIQRVPVDTPISIEQGNTFWISSFPIWHVGGISVMELENWPEITTRHRVMLREKFERGDYK